MVAFAACSAVAAVSKIQSSAERARTTKIVFDAIAALCSEGAKTFRPGDVASYLRAGSEPLGAWQIRGELAALERLGLIALDENTALWRLIAGASFPTERRGDKETP